MFKTTIQLTDSQVAGLLCTAFEGDVGYWAQVVGKRKPTGDCSVLDWKDYPLYSWPVSKGGVVKVKDIHTGKVYNLNRRSIEKGLKLMAEKNPCQFGKILNENEDAITGDVFLQFCTLGDELYG